MAGPRGLFFAVPCNAHHSPQLAALRLALGSTGDAYFYRALAFCKEYEQSGCLAQSWAAVAGFVLWPESPDDLAAAFRAAGAVEGAMDEIWGWHYWNGYLIDKAKKDAKRVADKRRAGRIGAARRRKQRQQQRAQRAVGWLVGSVGGVFEHTGSDCSRTVRGRFADGSDPGSVVWK